MKLIKLQIAVISLTLFACDKTTAAKKSDNDGATDKSNYEIGDEVGFLKASDVRTRSSLTKIDKKDLSDIINDMSFFYYTAPDEEENKCTTKLNTTKLAASGHRITIETNLDLMTCFDGKIDYVTSATTRNYFQGTCSDKKLDEHDNKGLADFQKEIKRKMTERERRDFDRNIERGYGRGRGMDISFHCQTILSLSRKGFSAAIAGQDVF